MTILPSPQPPAHFNFAEKIQISTFQKNKFLEKLIDIKANVDEL